MVKHNSDKPSTTWCVYFEVIDPPSKTYSDDNGDHYIILLLKKIYGQINEKCSKACKIPPNDIIFTQEDVEI